MEDVSRASVQPCKCLNVCSGPHPVTTGSSFWDTVWFEQIVWLGEEYKYLPPQAPPMLLTQPGQRIHSCRIQQVREAREESSHRCQPHNSSYGEGKTWRKSQKCSGTRLGIPNMQKGSHNLKGPFLFASGIHSNSPTDLCLELTWEIGPVFSAVGEAKMANTRSQHTASSYTGLRDKMP